MEEGKYILFIKLLKFEFQYKAVGVVLWQQICALHVTKTYFFYRVSFYFPETNNE